MYNLPIISGASQILSLTLLLTLNSGTVLLATPSVKPQQLPDYLQLAWQHNPGLKALSQRYQAAVQHIPQAAALPEPTIALNHFVESVQTRTGPQKNALTLKQQLPWFGSLRQRKAIASSQAEALWYTFQHKQVQITRQLSHAYYDYAYLGKVLKLSDQKTELLERLLPMVDQRVRGGGSLNALLRLKLEIARMKDQSQSLESSRLVQRTQLNQLMGQAADLELPWPQWNSPPASVLDSSALSLALREYNPELAQLRSRIEQADARQELARLDQYPKLTVGLNYIQIGQPTVNSHAADAGQDAWGISVAMNLPIGLQQQRAQRAERLSQRRAAELDYQQRLNSLQAELSSNIAQRNDANRRLELFGQELLQLAEQAVEISHSSYANGQASLLELIDSERSLLELQQLYWRAAADSWKHTISLQTLTQPAWAQP